MFADRCALKVSVGQFRSFSEEQFIRSLVQGYFQLTGEWPSIEERQAWKGSWPHIRYLFSQLPDDVWAIFEYQLPASLQRIDLILLGSNRGGKNVAVIVEMKGWSQVFLADYELVRADSGVFQHPEIQAMDYEAKLCYTHSEADRFTFYTLVWLYNLPPGQLTFQKVHAFFAGQDLQLASYLRSLLTSGLPQQEVDRFLAGRYVQSFKLLQSIYDNFEDLRKGAWRALAAKGFAPSEEQQRLMADILNRLRQVWNGNAEPTAFLVQGEPGSGKSYVAVLLLLKALAEAVNLGVRKEKVAVLGYRNNRLINTVRQVFQKVERGMDAVIQFSRTGQGHGLAEKWVPKPDFDLVIYDEAQRLSANMLENAFRRGWVVVFFYDEGQILNAEEQGTHQNFLEAARRVGYRVEECHLKGIYRVQGGRSYHKFVEKLLTDPLSLQRYPTFPNYELVLFTDIRDMLDALRERSREDNQVALVAAYTESPGDRKNKTALNLLNRRIGYPLYSGFEHYKGKDVDIYWLMDERQQYPQFWYERRSNDLTHCASIYGCQGFEADYVGVIWGRDMVWDPQEQGWTLGSNCEDDIVKGRFGPSLKELFKRKDIQQALPLLRNRYRIFLTRGIKGTFIYCEDEATTEFLRTKLPVRGQF
jgi:DUF2075 family protein